MVRSFRKSCCQPTDTRRSKPPKLKISAETDPAGRCYLAVRSGKFTLVILSGGFYLSPCQTAFAETTQESVKRASDQHSAVDRLTLLLVDRLPTSAERDLTRSFRRQPFVELAGRLTSGPEFFHRQALYWQSQLNNSPAWKWERSQNPYQIDVNAVSPERLSQLLWYVAPSTSSSLARSCGGVWTTATPDGTLQPCSCEDAIDVLPFWDKSSSMRVCPTTNTEKSCGKSLELCFPVDKRLSPRADGIEIDTDSAGGVAIGRLLTDLHLSNGRALALGVVTNEKWSRFPTLPFRTTLSNSSVALLKQWTKIVGDDLSLQLNQFLEFQQTPTMLDDLFATPPVERRRSFGFRTLVHSVAEKFILSEPHTNFSITRPLRFSKLSGHVWNWNNQLIFSCARPFVAQQVFPLPLPHPEKAKNASYFCSGCHMELDAFSLRSSINSERKPTATSQEIAKADCAVEHAIQFLTGGLGAGAGESRLKALGRQVYSKNSGSLSAVIRDLAVELAGGNKK
jgi:hypothetical protein